MVAIWLRGLVLRRKITDRKYRLALRAAALKALRAPCGPIPQYKILYYYIIMPAPPFSSAFVPWWRGGGADLMKRCGELWTNRNGSSTFCEAEL
jgi:hypothetical protein